MTSALVHQAAVTTVTVATHGKRKFPLLHLWLTQIEYCFGLYFTSQLHEERVDLLFVMFLLLQYICSCNLSYPCQFKEYTYWQSRIKRSSQELSLYYLSSDGIEISVTYVTVVVEI